MKLNNLVGERFKERPSNCEIDSHALSIRGGYVKNVGSGIFSLYPPMKRITKKIENIIREEMDAIDGQEVLFPVALPATLWEESGRYKTVGDELLRFTDRNDSTMVLGMTHEEASVQLVREYGQSYARYPFMIYQIQTKFRDEARPRAGLIRVREFTMKDAYSFHTSQEDLEAYYDRCYVAYNRVFQRAGVPEVVSVQSDSGMMGGSVSHEYMLLAEAGEDSLAICSNPECDYRANMEVTENSVENANELPIAELTKVYTPHCKTMEELVNFLNVPIEYSMKAVVYQRNRDDSYVVIFLRGDYDVNETKLTNILGEAVHPADITLESGIVAGFIGPYGLVEDATVIMDLTLEGIDNLVCGANEVDYHYTGFNIARDCGEVEFVDVAKVKTGGACPHCGQNTIEVKRGIEVGNIFQLGTKYSASMGMTYTDEKGDVKNPIMGCYGIGVGRLAASVCEAKHDENGPIWPISIAPWQVHLCCMRANQEECKSVSDQLYKDLQNAGVEVIYDDRKKVQAGAMFADADLLGVPVRVIVGPKNLKNNQIELQTRDKSVSKLVDINDGLAEIQALIADLYAELNQFVEEMK